MEIIGSGTIACAFEHSKLTEETCVLFASGVSSSLETRAEQFYREMNLLDSVLCSKFDKPIIYFSSCVRSGEHNIPYFRHKRLIERKIYESGKRFNIYRLPQLASTTSRHTLIGNFTLAVLLQKHMTINQSAERYLLATEDLVRIVSIHIKRRGFNSEMIDISSFFPISPLQVLHQTAHLLKKPIPPHTLIDTPDSILPQFDRLEKIIEEDDPLLSKHYASELLATIVPEIAKTAGLGS